MSFGVEIATFYSMLTATPLLLCWIGESLLLPFRQRPAYLHVRRRDSATSLLIVGRGQVNGWLLVVARSKDYVLAQLASAEQMGFF